jgi:hypothetical protein
MSPRGAAQPTAQVTLPQGRSFQPLKRLNLLPGNPRIISTSQFQSLMASLKRDPRFALVRPVAVADGPENQAGALVYGGNMRVRAFEQMFNEGWEPAPDLQKLGWKPMYVPVDVDDIPEPMARERAIQDNNTWGTWNDQELAEMLYNLDQLEGSDLSVLGFDQRVLDDLLASVGGTDEPERRADGRPADLPPQALTTEERMEIYENQAIRQVVLYYPKEDYEDILELLDWLRKHFQSETNTEAVTAALRAYRQTCDDEYEQPDDDE